MNESEAGMIGIVVFVISIIVLIVLIIHLIKALSRDKTVITAGAFVNSQVTKAKKYAQQNITKSYLTGSTWYLMDTNSNDSVLYNFKTNDDLYITKNGIVKKCKYEFIVDSESILISKNSKTEHYHVLNIQDNFFFLKRLSSNQIFALANQTKYKDRIKSELKKLAEEN
jgi:hypothetical protein